MNTKIKTKKGKKQAEAQEYSEAEKQKIDEDFASVKQKYNIQDSYEPKIQNVVSTVLLRITSTKDNSIIEKLDLDNLANKSSNCEYKKSRFPALIQRIKDPKSTALIFEAGKMVITGTKGQEEAKEAAQKFKKTIEKTNKVTITIENIQTSNIVANSQLPFQVNLVKINDDKDMKGSNSYDRQAFPGLIYKMQDPKLAALIFYSGKIVFTGAKNEHQIRRAYIMLVEILKKHASNNQQR